MAMTEAVPSPTPRRLTRRQRAKLIRGVQYSVGLLVVAVVALTADWGRVKTAFFDVDVARGMFPEVITIGLKNTVTYTTLGFGFGLALGLVLALMRLSSIAVYRWVARGYIEFFRGLPALLVLIAIGYGIPTAFPGTILNRNISIMVALGIVSSAYVGEVIRAGIQAVPRGQVEAARSLGMSPTKTMIWIVIPQAFRIVLPPLTNDLIALTKDYPDLPEPYNNLAVIYASQGQYDKARGALGVQAFASADAAARAVNRDEAIAEVRAWIADMASQRA